MDTTNPRLHELEDLASQYHAQYGTGPKFTDADVQGEPELMDLALEYLALWDGTFTFLADLKAKSQGNLSVGQARGVLNTMLAQKRRLEHPIEDTEIVGIVMNGFYFNPVTSTTLEVRPWREDGTRMIRVLNPLTGHWDAFASINPNSTYRIWGKYNAEHIRNIANAFFTVGNEQRLTWAKNYSDTHNVCWADGHNPPTTELGLCENCATGQWAASQVATSLNTEAPWE